MSSFQRLLVKILPAKLAQEMEADSRRWTFRCETCGLERSVWEAGGVRWKATGNPRKLLNCPHCDQPRLHTLYRKET